MTESIRYMMKCLPAFLPFILLAFLSMKVNLKREVRSRQVLMPFVALVYVVVISAITIQFNQLILNLIDLFANWLENFNISLPSFLPDALSSITEKLSPILETVSEKISGLGTKLKNIVNSLNPFLLLFYVENTAFLVIFLIIKRIVITIMKKAFQNGNEMFEALLSPMYCVDENSHTVYLRQDCVQTRSYMKAIYIAVVAASGVLALFSCYLVYADMLQVPFYPVMVVILVGEISFILGGLTKQEDTGALEGEADRAEHKANYALMRDVLRGLFGDKLSAQSTTVHSGLDHYRTNREVIEELTQSRSAAVENYGHFLNHKLADGMELDHSYVNAGRELVEGNSVLFNNPFYYDLIPYLFYPVNRQLLNHKKVLIVLGRLGIEEEIQKWCLEGLVSVNNTPPLWSIGLLDSVEQSLDVGILTRSMVHDIELHERNADFLSRVGMVILIEPSRLVTTAQIGLNSIVRCCSDETRRPVFCSIDKNCDGLLDALSHILMVSLTEVSATDHHRGKSSYMCWDGDSEHMQHRMLPNLSRYLGFGTELSVAALKNQISDTYWYGGDTFPVTDIGWIAGQYYYDLLDYASLPPKQETLEAKFHLIPEMWSARRKEKQYLTVEDESCNLFEIRRNFVTRAVKEGFVNIISQDYLMKEYMTDLAAIFSSDPKAIPYIVADYAHTSRNVVLRLCLRMSVGIVWEAELNRELLLIDAADVDPVRSLWHEICKANHSSKETQDVLTFAGTEDHRGSGEVVFTQNVIRTKRKYNLRTGKMETCYYIDDPRFIRGYVSVLKNAEYIAEDERGNHQYLGSEVMGQIYQGNLPGQFMTIAGKYYEMLRVTSDNKVLLRRAADHITGRVHYRQQRAYILDNLNVSDVMGDVRAIDGLQTEVLYGDIRVRTDAYWKMDRYHDFKTAKKVVVNGIPERRYYNKKVLRIGFEGGSSEATPEILRTLTILMNELFVTLFAENRHFIVAVTPGGCEIPLTYSVEGTNESELSQNSIYIIEDSQLDIGLIEAVQRNLDRIYSVLCDYLDWHGEALEESLNPPPEPEVKPVELPEPTRKKKGPLGRILDKFRGIFRRKKGGKKDSEKDPESKVTATEAVPEAAAGETEKETVTGEPAAGATAVEANAAEANSTEANAADLDVPDTNAVDTNVSETNETEANNSETGSLETENREAEGTQTEETEINDEIMFSATKRILYAMDAPGKEHEADQKTAESLEFETADAQKIGSTGIPVRKPYHMRHYLLFGGNELPAGIEPGATLEFLKDRGYGNSELKQAREGAELSKILEGDYEPGKAGRHYCDFCGAALTGAEYEVLGDGRERCMNCSRTAIKTEEEFVELYHSVLDFMQSCYGIKIQVPIRVRMVNSRRLHKALGKTFVPTGNADGRVLGVAISSKAGYELLLENGSPRMSSAMTMAHELTHIWQYLNWDRKEIRKKYGKANELLIYEGMAKWAEIQYAYLVNESVSAKREEIITRSRDDEYGQGFLIYESRYPISESTELKGDSPFMHNPPV